ncbi:branched-chain-amino-acid aminotransferase, cytosolic [Lingula anatina]|uniref:Branched-chain-amino-acid aminotransferase n=1 Tax=Lingula anatina TaxID=7574 RepID=A0A1S3JE90_LINAN|nr:branched-chain-amino-acid aminotransferase, cytosolic [Lingula anatina]|eukprot:XP_013408204.1 branched-chain-amino-acid aminotransferase, cytosolic [Lingula anatina]
MATVNKVMLRRIRDFTSLCHPLKHCGNLNIVRCLSASSSTFKYDDLEIELSKTLRPKPDPNSLVFGKEFSDHMLEVEWHRDSGWGKPRITPLHNLSLHPGAKALHYAVELFEGMKAFRGVDGKIRLFRPEENMKRMNNSATRCCLPNFDGLELLKCIKKLIRVEKDWVPHSTSSSLYIRPTFIGTEPTLGVTVSNQALLYVLVGPVGPYYPTGMKPVTLLADPTYVRAWPGGAGASKLGSNYGPTISIQNMAAQHGCQQVLWLFGEEQNLTEVGTMNIFVYLVNEQGEKELVTPALKDNLILPGVTRKSLLELAYAWGQFKVSERRINMGELTKALAEKRVLEIFGAGTACVVCPVEKILYQGEFLQVPTMEQEDSLNGKFFQVLTDMQYGRQPSDWMVDVD